MRGLQTTAEHSDAHSDVPTSSLYRQLTRLRDAGMLRVAAERPIRGATERTYELASRDAGAFSGAELEALPASKLRAAFHHFVAGMVADVSACIESVDCMRGAVRVGVQLAVCELTDTEYVTLQRELQAAVMRAGSRSTTSASATRRYFYLISLPGHAGAV